MRILETHRRAILLLAVTVAVSGPGCGEERPPLPGSGTGTGTTTTPPPRAAAPPSGTEKGVELPLKLTGIGSKAELDRALGKIQDPELQAEFEKGFRGSFVIDRNLRRYDTARDAMQKILEEMPGFAPAYRVLAYARFNLSFDMPGATEMYEKAVQADPDYGEAHYALAFMLTQFDIERGRVHFDRAMELGVPDERDLRGNWYPDAP